MSHKIDLFTALLWTTLAGAGGVVRYLSSQLKSGQKISMKTLTFMIVTNAVISGFSGMMLSLVATTMTDDHTIYFICAGIGGYLGVEVLNMLSSVVKSRIKSLEPPKQ